ncbi:MAG: hypothetical protein KDB27_21145 [Planctomycetales bacterium]|nr:hypothetical protein [Planctomycetales bacterium]
MQINISGETERLIQEAMAEGRFASVEEFLHAMATTWQRQTTGKIVPMRKHINAETLIKEQGVLPCTEPENLATPIWPKEESTDAFLQFLRHSRGDSLTQRL